jgi:hypothetical protein
LLVAVVTVPKVAVLMFVWIPPKVTLFVTFWQSTANINLTLSGVMLKLRRTLMLRLYTLGFLSPKGAVLGASPNINALALQKGPVLEAHGTGVVPDADALIPGVRFAI